MPGTNPNNIPQPLPELSHNDIERFLSKVDTRHGQGPKGDCHAYCGCRTKRGYGVFVIFKDGKTTTARANRVAYKIHSGKDPAPDLVKHSCDWPPCVRGEHLSLGDNDTNMREAAERFRMATGDKNGSRLYPERLRRGSTHGMSKLNEESVAKIRELKSSGLTATAIAEQFGMSISTISRILKGNLWAHGEGPRFTGNLTPQGENHYGAVANPEMVKSIRKDFASGITYAELHRRYPLSLFAIRAIVLRRTWKSVTD